MYVAGWLAAIGRVLMWSCVASERSSRRWDGSYAQFAWCVLTTTERIKSIESARLIGGAANNQQFAHCFFYELVEGTTARNNADSDEAT